MYEPDRREEFKDVPWQQGFLLVTSNTVRWSKQHREDADRGEKCTAYANFSPYDLGRSRIYLYRFNTPEECYNAVKEHNAALAPMRRGTV